MKFNILEINNNYLKIQKDLNLNISLVKNLKNKIKLGLFSHGLKNGGRAKLTSILINYFYSIKMFNIYLFTRIDKNCNEYLIPEDIKRMTIKDNLKKLIKNISKNKIDILIYNLDNYKEVNYLNNRKTPKIIYYQHSSFFYFLYSNYTSFLSLYKAYKNAKYVVSLVPLENSYIFKYWGINSILMSNFVTFNYNLVIPSNLLSKTILMIGRGYNKLKRFNLGINAMEYIIKEDSKCEMKIISILNKTNDLQNLVYNLNLENQIKFIGYSLIPDLQFRNASLHIFPSISESFGLVLSEAKIYGIPNILVGLDYVQISKGGTIIIYDDNPESIAKESIKIIKNETYRKNLGRKARFSMIKFNNQLLFYKWVKLILSIYNGDDIYNKLKAQEKLINKIQLKKLLLNQIKLLKKRNIKFFNISIKDFQNFNNLYKFQ
jgi:glycosyltransferase involved in cell wall biosynthesis